MTNQPAQTPETPKEPTISKQPDAPSLPQARNTSAVSINSGAAAQVVISQDPVIDETRLRSLGDPFTPAPSFRPPARDVIHNDIPADGALLRQFVTTQRLRDLWTQLEALQEDVIQNVRADRTNTDAYQQDLLYANSLLLQSPANYDEARQIVFRVRADLQRERRVLADIRMYRPRLMVYYVVWFVVTLLAVGLDPEFRKIVPSSLPILKLTWLPVLFGVLGALFNGMMALHEHTTVRRDFEPVHNTWYMLNPFMGGMTGLVVFIFFVVTSSSFTPSLTADPKVADAQVPLVICLLAFIVGWQQNILFRLLNRFLKAFATDSRRATETTGTTADETPPPRSAAG